MEIVPVQMETEGIGEEGFLEENGSEAPAEDMDAYSAYIDEVLAPQKGYFDWGSLQVRQTGEECGHLDVGYGIISALVSDVNQDGTEDLLIISADSPWGGETVELVLDCYTLEQDSVVQKSTDSLYMMNFSGREFLNIGLYEISGQIYLYTESVFNAYYGDGIKDNYVFYSIQPDLTLQEWAHWNQNGSVPIPYLTRFENGVQVSGEYISLEDAFRELGIYTLRDQVFTEYGYSGCYDTSYRTLMGTEGMTAIMSWTVEGPKVNLSDFIDLSRDITSTVTDETGLCKRIRPDLYEEESISSDPEEEEPGEESGSAAPGMPGSDDFSADTCLSGIFCYDAAGTLLCSQQYAYYRNGLPCSITVYSYSAPDSESEEQDPTAEYGWLFYYDAAGNLSGSEWYQASTARSGSYFLYQFLNGYVIDPSATELQNMAGVDPSRTETVYGGAQVFDFTEDTSWIDEYMAQVFDQTMNQVDTSYTSCQLMYVNDDDIPEMHVNYGYAYLGNLVYYLNQGTVLSVGADHGKFSWKDRENLLLVQEGLMGYYSNSLYRMDENGMNSIYTEYYEDFPGYRSEQLDSLYPDEDGTEAIAAVFPCEQMKHLLYYLKNGGDFGAMQESYKYLIEQNIGADGSVLQPVGWIFAGVPGQQEE